MSVMAMHISMVVLLPETGVWHRQVSASRRVTSISYAALCPARAPGADADGAGAAPLLGTHLRSRPARFDDSSSAGRYAAVANLDYRLPLVRIERIEIDAPADVVPTLRRELQLAEGDLFHESKLEESRRRGEAGDGGAPAADPGAARYQTLAGAAPPGRPGRRRY